MERLDERSWSVWAKHVDKQGIICRVEAAKAEANEKERRQEEPEGGYPWYEQDEEADAHQTKGKEGQLLPTLLDVQTEDEACDDCCYASAEGTACPDEVDLFVRDSNLQNKSKFKLWFEALFFLKVIDLGRQKGLRWSKYAHGEAEAAMAGPGKGEIGGEPDGLPRAAHHPSSEQGPSLPSKWGQPPPQLQNAPLRESPGKLREHLLQRTKQFE